MDIPRRGADPRQSPAALQEAPFQEAEPCECLQMSEAAVYSALFASAFLSATLLPGSSEAALIGLLAVGQGSPAVLVAVATLGNVLGSLVNWVLGRFFSRFRDRRWFPIDR